MMAAPPTQVPPTQVPMSREESDALARRRRGRNIAMLVVLVGLVVLFYAIAMVKMSGSGMAP